MIGDSAIGLVLRLSAKKDTSEVKSFREDVEKELKSLDDSGSGKFSKLAQSIGLSAEKTAMLSNALPVAGAALAGLSAVAVGTAAALFNIAQSAADFGSEINDASEKTGLSAESLSAMKFAADQAGSSLEAVSGATTKFTRLVAEAAQGSESAAKKLKALGIDPKDAIDDLDGALGKVFARIASLPDPVSQTKAAIDAFGKSGAELLPFIKSFDGDLPGLIAKAKELGVTLTDSDAKAADEFGDTLDTLKSQAQGVAFQFAKEFMPDITNAMMQVSDWFMRNKDTVRAWGKEVQNEIYVAIDLAEKLAKLWKILVAPDWESIKKAYNEKTSRDIRLEEAAQMANVTVASSNEYTPIGTVLHPLPGKSNDDLGYLDESKVAAKAKKAGKTAAEEFDKGFREFAKENDFVVSRTKGGAINSGSKHPLGLAGDLSIKGKSVEEIVSILATGIQKGYRVADERFIGAIPGIKSTGPNAHFESQGSTKPSLFVENRPDLYGGQAGLDYLKKLDEDRRNKKTSIDEIAEFEKKAAEDKKKANEQAVKDREQADRRVLEKAKNTASEEKAINEKLLAEKKISQDEFDKRAEQSAIDLLTKEKNLLDERLKLAQDLGVETVDIEQEIADKVSEIKVRQTEAETAAYLQSKKYQEDLKALRLEVAQSERELIDVRKASERENLEEDVQNARGNSNRLTALVVLREFDLKENERRRDAALKQADDERKVALDGIENQEKEKEKVEEINKLYENRLAIINETYEAQNKQTNKDFKPDIDDASRSDAAQTIDDIFGLSDETIDRITGKVEVLKGVFAGLEFSVKSASRGMVAALGSAIEGYLLYGDSIGKALKKAAAAELAHISSVSAIKAIYQLAEGFASLFFNPAAAAAHFQAAALYGIVAVGAGIGAKALAGDSFKQQNAGAYGSAGGGGQNNRGYTGGAYSGAGDAITTFNGGISAPQIIEHRVDLTDSNGDRKNFIIRTLKDDNRDNGDFRGLITNIVNAL